MFLNSAPKNNQLTTNEPVSFWSSAMVKKIGIAAAALAGVLIIVVVAAALFKREPMKELPPSAYEEPAVLPPPADTVNRNNAVAEIGKLKAEEVFFGNYFEPENLLIDPKAAPIELPINVKNDAANYYSFTRQIDLDAVIDDLNNRGFAVIENPFPAAKDFYSVYGELNNRNLPFLVTSDFMIYYFQNRLKEIYKTIEGDNFYAAFWNLNKELFEQSDKRYRDRYAKEGMINDPLLEALRLEAVYFAINLELLKPKPGQIMPSSKESVIIGGELSDKFSSLEAQEFVFTAPDYLEPTISKELELITKAAKTNKLQKSPALLYDRDYTEFVVPDQYRRQSRLNNFYLASRWTRSVFPLFFRNENCPNCLLDEDDWSINLTAAALISRDLSANQDWQNEWAKVYKLWSYFDNLRSELTYVDYAQAFTAQFGGQTVEDVLGPGNGKRMENLIAWQSRLAAFDFDPLSGGFDRQTEEGRRLSGLRILADEFNPDQYFYNKLIGKPAGNFINYDNKAKYDGLLTGCNSDYNTMYRCRAFGADILNLIFDEPITWQYFAINTNYQGYGNATPTLRRHLAAFDKIDWHLNLYWTTLDGVRNYLNSRRQQPFSHTLGAAWTEQGLKTGLGANLNANLPNDDWRPAYQRSTSVLPTDNLVKYHFVEPNLALINNLLADARMIYNVSLGLGLAKENHAEFTDLIADLNGLKELAVKEHQNQDFNFSDWQFANELVTKFYAANLGAKSKTLIFNHPELKRTYRLDQSLGPVKLLVEAQRQQGKVVLVAGPIFNYQEKAR